MSSPDDSGATVDESIAKHASSSIVARQVTHGEAYFNGLRTFLGQMQSGELLRSEFARMEQSDDDACSQDSENDESIANSRQARLEIVS